MKSVNITNAREQIYKLVDETITEHLPVQIISKKGNVVLVSESDWNSVMETLYLVSIPEMRESIIEGLNTPIEECVEEINWDSK